jgi:hypothetical protein
VPRRNIARMHRRGRGLSLAGIAALGLATIAAPAHAALTAVSPSMDGLGLPQWYDDGTQKLTICPTGTPNCGALVPFVGPGGEAFYNRAVAKLAAGNVKLTVGLAVEAAFDPVFQDTPVTFTRIRSRITGAEPSSTYTVVEPFGTQTVATDGAGSGTTTDQVGCAITSAGAPCDWSAALRGGVGPWLRWDPAADPQAPAGFLGDAATDHTIIGSPLGHDFVEMSGPGITSLRTDLFQVTGKMFDPNVAAFGAAPAAFGGQRVGTKGAARQVVLRNDGGAAMTVSAVTVTGAHAGDFAIAKNGCITTVAPNGGTCTVDVTFLPTAAGARSATLSVADDAPGNPHTAGLSGTGTLSVLAASPGGVGYGSQTVGTTTPPRSVDVANNGSAPLNVSAIAIVGANAGDYSVGVNTCSAAVAAGVSCHVEVLFTPSAAGVRNATLSIAGDGGKADVSLSGTGVAPAVSGGTQAGGSAATSTATGTTSTTTATTPAHASSARPPLSTMSLGMAARIKQSKARKLGFRLTMRVPDGTVVVRIRVYRKTGKDLTLLSDGYRTPAAAGLFRVQQSHLQLRRQLKRGAYEVQVTPGYSTRELGVTSKISFKVV